MRRFTLDYLPKDLDRIGANEWRPASQGLIEDRSQAVNIPAGGGLFAFAAGLFWWHVTDCAHDDAGLRQVAATFDELGQSEIGKVWLPLLVEENVAWFEIPVQHTSLMGVMHGSSDDGKHPRRAALG